MSLESQRRAKKLYKLRHRDKVNAQRRAARLRKREQLLVGKRCGCCTKLLQYDAKRALKYCSWCRTNARHELRALEPKNKKTKQRQRKRIKKATLSPYNPRLYELHSIASYDI